MTTDDRHRATEQGVRDAWDFWLSQHDISVPELIEDAIRKEWRRWLDDVEGELVSAIAAAAASTVIPAAPPPPTVEQRDRWGGWRLNSNTYVLVTHGPGYAYEVDLERCLTPAQALDWICQVSGSTWATDATLAGIVRAMNDALGPQAHLCPSGKPRRLTQADVRALCASYAARHPDRLEPKEGRA